VGLLERRGVLIADPECPELDFPAESSLEHLKAASIQYRIAIDPQAGRRSPKKGLLMADCGISSFTFLGLN